MSRIFPINQGMEGTLIINDPLQLYKDLIETSQILMWSLDSQGRCTFVNPAWEKTLGYRREEMLGREFSDFQTPDAAACHESRFPQVPGGADDERVETVLVGRSGNQVHLVFHVHFLRDQRGTFMGAHGSAYDITERKQAEQRLRASEEKYRSIAELSAELVWEMNLEGKHTSFNPVITTLLGYRPEEILDKPAFFFMHPEDRARVEGDLPRLLAEKRGWRGWIVRWRHRDDTYRFFESNAEPILDTDGQLLGYRGSDRDVTEGMRAKQMEHILHAVVRGLFSSRDLCEGSARVLQAVLQLESVDSGGFYLVDPATGALDLLAHRGLSDPFVATVRHFPGDAPRVLLVRTGEARYGSFSQLHPSADITEHQEGLRGMAVIPIMCDGALIAVLNLASHTHDSIPPESRRSLETIAFQIGGMLLRLRSEEALRESEEIFQQFMDHSPIYVFFQDERLRFLRLSSNCARLLGKPIRELLGKSLKELLPPETAEKLMASDRRVLAEEKQLTIEEEWNGRWYTIIKFPISIEGKPRCLAGYAIDITDRKLAEEAIGAEKERLAITLRSIGDGVITTDIRGRIVIMNKVAEELTGWCQGDVQGKLLAEVFRIVSGGASPSFENLFEEVMDTGEIVEIDGPAMLASRSGAKRQISSSGAPIKDRNSGIIGMVLVFRDMTEKQRLMESLQRIDKLDSLGVLAGGIAHDFNNLLCGILGHLDLARALSTGHARILSHLEKALGVFSRARDLTQQLLTFSKGGVPRRKAGPLGSLIQDSAAFVLSGSNVRCACDIDGDLWFSEFDENQIGQVIHNLVINARQAMPLGGQIMISANNTVLRSGEISSLPAGNYVKVSIADAGPGIPGDILGRIFDPFFTTKPMGNGLGLSIGHSIMQKHDGFIGVESAPGMGTRFHLYFPASGQEVVKGADVHPPHHAGNGCMLIMDDEAIIRDVMGQMLKGMGYSVVEASDGQEALAFLAKSLARGEPVTAAFFDLTIPGGLGGKETVWELRKTHPDLPVFASSGYAEDPAMARPNDFGFTASIHKPYLITDLADLLNRHLKVRAA